MTSLTQTCANCNISRYVNIKLNVSSYRLSPRLKIKCRRKCKIQAKSFEGYVQNAKTSQPKKTLNDILLNDEENPEKWISYENPIKPGSEENKLLNERNQSNGEKVSIPGIPEDNAEIERCVWEWRPKLRVHYWKSGSQNLSSPAVLFLPGFGVGAFHFVNQLKDLGKDFRVWSIDFIGQGQSLPSEDPAPSLQESDEYWGFGPQPQDWASELVFSVDLWRQQIHDFVEQVVNFLMRGWIKNSESLGMMPLPLFHSADLFETDNWRTFEFPRMGSLKKVQVRMVGDKRFCW